MLCLLCLLCLLRLLRRGAISLIMCQVFLTDEAFVERSPLVAAQVERPLLSPAPALAAAACPPWRRSPTQFTTLQMGLWCSLFVLSTLLVNAPTVPALLRSTGLNKVGASSHGGLQGLQRWQLTGAHTSSQLTSLVCLLSSAPIVRWLL